MGQAKRKMEMRVNAAEIAKARAEFKKTIPMRLFKGFTAFVLLIPLTMFAFSVESFRKNQWPWKLQ